MNTHTLMSRHTHSWAHTRIHAHTYTYSHTSNNSCLTNECVICHIRTSHVPQIGMSCAMNMNESSPRYIVCRPQKQTSHVPHLIHMCDMNTYIKRVMSQTSSIRATWLIHMCDMTHPYVRKHRSYVWHDSCTCVTWLIHMCDMTTYIKRFMSQTSFTCVTWLIHLCDMIILSVTWLINMCDMTTHIDRVMSHKWLHSPSPASHSCVRHYTFVWHLFGAAHCMSYGVATISRLLKCIDLFCKTALYKRRYSAEETYNFKEPTNRSHPICQKDAIRMWNVSHMNDSRVMWSHSWKAHCISYVWHDNDLTRVTWWWSHTSNESVCCSVLQCVALCCSVLQCVAVCCSALFSCVLQWHDDDLIHRTSHVPRMTALHPTCESFMRETWLICMASFWRRIACDMLYERFPTYLLFLIFMILICETKLIHMWNTTHSFSLAWNMTVSTENPPPPRSTKSRHSSSSVHIQIKSKSQSKFVPRDT